MKHVPLIVIGASAGGIDAFTTILGELSPKIPAAILAVIHIGDFNAKLPALFKDRTPLPVVYPEDGAPIERGKVYFALPDRHLIVEDGRLRLGSGPRENHARPAIDPLFRSAAEVYGPLVIGVILTGFLTDGTAGLWEVKRRGGIAIVQDPDDAEVPSMPNSALQHVSVDHCVPLDRIGSLLNSLAAEAAQRAPQMASHGGESDMEYTTDSPVAMSCATCGGALRRSSKGTYAQFRCHIGHTFGIPELMKEQYELLRTVLETGARLLNERAKLFREMASEERIDAQTVMAWETAADESEARFDVVTRLLESHWKRPELITASSRKLRSRNAPRERPAQDDLSNAAVEKRNRKKNKLDDRLETTRARNG